MVSATQAVLQVEGLQIEYRSGRGAVRAVNGVDLTLRQGETWGLVGESGCGKSTLAKAVLRLLPPSGHVVEGRILLDGVDVLTLSAEELRRLRWAAISIVPQNALNALNPVLPVGDQITEILSCHQGVGRRTARERVRELFEMVSLPASRMGAYPHQFSGGMRQRVAIAAALALEPRLIIADEPTTALDIITQRLIIDRVKEIQRQAHFALLWITHDLGVVRGLCDRLAIMYAGEIVEAGAVEEVFHDPGHPYTVGLLSSVATLGGDRRRLRGIPGNPPHGASLERRCQFAGRCPIAVETCSNHRPSFAPSRDGTRLVACHRAPEVPDLLAWRPVSPVGHGGFLPVTAGKPILEVEKVAVDFRDHGLHWFGPSPRSVRAVDGVSFVLHDSETLGIVGESGSGKTTLARTLLRLVRPTEGAIRYKGRDVSTLRGEELRWFRREVQIIFQDPYESLNPAFTISRSIEEPLRVLGASHRRGRQELVHEVLGRVGLSPPSEFLHRYPHELSGGQLQRVSIARALVVEPSLLIADEPVSMLDVSIRAEILSLLDDLVQERHLACIYVSHDLALVRYLCSRTLVMYKGRIIEEGPTEAVIRRPHHPYTAAMIRAVPTVEHGILVPLTVLPQERTDVPQPACRFYPRCPMAFDACRWVEPGLEPVGTNGHTARCHLFGPLGAGRTDSQGGCTP